MKQNILRGRDIISMADFSKEDILYILRVADQVKKSNPNRLLSGCLMGSCFFEPSTRTRLSFEAAMKRLGGDVIGFADSSTTSAKKGETLYDSIKIIGQYVDIIVMRHPVDGSARRAAEATDTPIINAGDGSNQHPTQTLLDLYTIKESQKSIDGIHIALVGDLKYGRTAHSLAQALSHFNVRLYFIAPPSLQIPPHIANHVKAKQVKFSFHEKLDDVLPKLDILYMTRIQEERFSDSMEYNRVKDVFRLTLDQLGAVRPSMRILHPLPRVREIDPSIDATPHAYYFQQAQNGLLVRQAVLSLVLGKIE
ncbi:aspartate carbamoyltransferase [Candidatus Uhrbacteria bacterium]|nr:aspartate carbamoyltransferase [Candidatus Uhrbacteria bacterium]